MLAFSFSRPEGGEARSDQRLCCGAAHRVVSPGCTARAADLPRQPVSYCLRGAHGIVRRKLETARSSFLSFGPHLSPHATKASGGSKTEHRATTLESMIVWARRDTSLKPIARLVSAARVFVRTSKTESVRDAATCRLPSAAMRRELRRAVRRGGVGGLQQFTLYLVKGPEDRGEGERDEAVGSKVLETALSDAPTPETQAHCSAFNFDY